MLNIEATNKRCHEERKYPKCRHEEFHIKPTRHQKRTTFDAPRSDKLQSEGDNTTMKAGNNMAKQHGQPIRGERIQHEIRDVPESVPGPMCLANTLCQMAGIHIPTWNLASSEPTLVPVTAHRTPSTIVTSIRNILGTRPTSCKSM